MGIIGVELNSRSLPMLYKSGQEVGGWGGFTASQISNVKQAIKHYITLTAIG